MKTLKDTSFIYGGSFRSAAGTMGASITGAAMGAVIGAALLDPALLYFNIQSQSYMGQMKTAMTNLYLYNKYGYMGIDSKNDIIGAIGGALIGSIAGPTIYVGLTY